MSGPFNVSENIGFDGYSYYCRRCGKAGYQRATQVRGHLAMCPGTLSRKGILPTTTYNQLPTGNGAALQHREANQLQPLRAASGGDAGGSQLLQPLAVVGPVDNHLAGNYQELDRRVAAIENEYAHLLYQRNRPQQSWPSKNIAWIVLAGIMLIGLLSGMGQSCECPAPGSPPKRSSGPRMTKLSERVMNKAADVAITKSLGRIFS